MTILYRTTRMVQERSSLQTIPHCRQTPGHRPAKAGDSYELPFTSDQADKPQVNLNLMYVVYINHIPDCMHVPCLLKIIRDYLNPLVFPFSWWQHCEENPPESSSLQGRLDISEDSDK